MVTRWEHEMQAAQTIGEEIDQVAAAYRVWGQKEDRLRLERLRALAAHNHHPAGSRGMPEEAESRWTISEQVAENGTGGSPPSGCSSTCWDCLVMPDLGLEEEVIIARLVSQTSQSSRFQY